MVTQLNKDEIEFVLENLETKMKTGQKQRTKMKGSQIHMEEKLILAKNQIALIIWRNTILKSKKRKKRKKRKHFPFSFLF